jgi:hypothetical protein
MKKRLFPLLSVFFMATLLTSCYYDNEEDLYPNNASSCDTTNVTYSGSIATIMAANCISCHSQGNAQKDIVLDNYSSVAAQAQSGQLWLAVSHDPSVVPMPYQGSKLSNCDLTKIQIWIRKGEPQ